MTVGPPMRVLVVEDDADLRMIMEHELRRAGHEVLVAVSGGEAVALAADVDLVLLDFHLPGANGLEVMQRIQEIDPSPSVVMVTGDDLQGLDEEAMRAGAVDFVPKRPGYLRALPGIVERAARQHDLSRRMVDLESVALGLLGADHREDAIAEILHGACRMLKGTDAALVSVGSPPTVLGLLGGAGEAVDAVLGMPDPELPSPGSAMLMGEDVLIVALPRLAGEGRLLLLVGGRDPISRLGDERDLARAYGRVAATALRVARRRRDQAEVLQHLHHSATRNDRAGSQIATQLERALDQLGTLHDLPLDGHVQRVLGGVEALVQAARDAANDLSVGDAG